MGQMFRICSVMDGRLILSAVPYETLGASGLTLIRRALLNNECASSRSGASRAPAKLGMHPPVGNGRRAAPESLSAFHLASWTASLASRRSGQRDVQ